MSFRKYPLYTILSRATYQNLAARANLRAILYVSLNINLKIVFLNMIT